MSSTSGGFATPPPQLEAIAYHDRLAESWNARYERGGFRRRANFFLNKVLPRINGAGDWLDVGCGSGYFSRILAAQGARVTGVDGSGEMVAAASLLSSDAALGRFTSPRYEVQTIEQLAGRQDRFDGVMCLNVIEYLNSPAERFADLAAMLRPGGTLIVSAPNKSSVLRNVQLIARRLMGSSGKDAFAYLNSSGNAWTKAQLAALAVGRGLVVDAVLGFDPVLPPAVHALAPPSLWYLICRKPAAGAAS